MKFEEYSIGDIGEIIAGGTPKTSEPSYWGGEISWITPKDLSTHQEMYIDSGSRNITEKGLKKSSAKLLPKGTILLSTRAPIGYVAIANKELSTNQGFKNIVLNEGFDKKFIYYLLKSNKEYLEGFAAGTTFKELSASSIKKIKFQIPDLESQKYIGNVLYSIDKKISLNKQVIVKTEYIATLLFKHWFIDFEFPNEQGQPYKSSGGKMVESELGMIPEGWKINSLTEIATYKNGLAMQKYRPKENEKSLPVLKIKELNEGIISTNSDLCSVNIKEEVKVCDGDVIFSWSGTLLVKLWTGGNAGLNQHLFKVTSSNFPKWFYYLWTKHHLKNFIGIAKDKATTMGHINRAHLEKSLVAVPPDAELKQMNKTFESLIDKQTSLGLENRQLTNLRNILLPKLLSGEIEVPVLEPEQV